MAGVVTITEVTHLPVKKVLFDWMSDGDGDADAVTTNSYTGMVERVVFVPDPGGTAPLADYDVYVNDDDGVDVLIANGVDLSETLTVQKDNVTDGLGAVCGTTLTLDVQNAGATKGGKTIVYIR